MGPMYNPYKGWRIENNEHLRSCWSNGCQVDYETFKQPQRDMGSTTVYKPSQIHYQRKEKSSLIYDTSK